MWVVYLCIALVILHLVAMAYLTRRSMLGGGGIFSIPPVTGLQTKTGQSVYLPPGAARRR